MERKVVSVDFLAEVAVDKVGKAVDKADKWAAAAVKVDKVDKVVAAVDKAVKVDKVVAAVDKAVKVVE
jgi:hypothetical protein